MDQYLNNKIIVSLLISQKMSTSDYNGVRLDSRPLSLFTNACQQDRQVKSNFCVIFSLFFICFLIFLYKFHQQSKIQ